MIETAFLPSRTGLALLLVATVLSAGACGKNENPPAAPAPTPRVVVTPSAATVLVHSTQAFTSATENLPSSDVSWSLEPATVSTDSVGTIDSTGLYLAPARVRGGFDFQIRVIATSKADTSVKGSALVTVPRVIVSVVPSNIGSVPPGTPVPFVIDVQNAPNPGFELFVEGVPGGNAVVGTWTQTGPGTAVYEAPTTQGQTKLQSLLVRSLEDSMRFNSSNVTIRAGFPLTVLQDRSQYAPEWSPTDRKVAYAQEGVPWEIVVHDVDTDLTQTVATFQWDAPAYDGRISWSPDGDTIVFSERLAGAPAIGRVGATGLGRATFAPQSLAEYHEAAYLPTEPGEPDSLIVSRRFGGAWQLRVYAAGAAPGDSGAFYHAAPPGWQVRWPDAIRLSGDLVVVTERNDGLTSQVVAIERVGQAQSINLVAQLPGKLSQVRWAFQNPVPWVTFVWDGNDTVYRVRRTGNEDPLRLYSEFFPESATDLSVFTDGEHVVSRLEASNEVHPWVIEFPPPDFLGVPKAEERELRSMGIRGALRPSQWSRWLGAGRLTLGADRRWR